MSTTYGNPTYAQIIDDLRSDVGNGSKLAHLSDEAIQKWILDAQERIALITEIREAYHLGLNEGVSEYPFQDRPPITNATNATPIVVTSASHGLSNDDRISVAGVGGNSGANGLFQVYSVTTDTFSLRKIWDITDATNATPIEIEAEGHEVATGDSVTVSGVLGNTAANGTFTATKVDANHFTLNSSVGNGTYSGAGTITKPAAGTGTYTAGGRYWRDDELPTYINRLIVLERPWGNFIRETHPAEVDFITMKEKEDTDVVMAFTSWDAPALMGTFRRAGVKYLRLYPAPLEDKTAVLTAGILPVARLYTSDSLSCNIILGSEYERMIRHYVKAKLYDFLENDKRRQEEDAWFFKSMQEFDLHKPSHPRLQVRYQ